MVGQDFDEKNLSDEKIVKLTLENQDNFVLIVNRYKLRLYSFVCRLTNASREDAEDMMQEIFLKIYLNLNGFDRAFKFSSWVYAIARNHVISVHRKTNARAEGCSSSIETFETGAFVAEFNIEQLVDNEITKRLIIKILEKLDSKYREVLILKYLEEKDYNEIADIIQKPPGTVGFLINKAKKEFKQELFRQNIKLK